MEAMDAVSGKKAFWKNCRRAIWGNKRRSLLLLLITALGSAFFVGLRSTSPDMNLTFDRYFDSQAMYDIQIVSNLGLTKDNVEAFRAVEGVERVEPAYSADLFAQIGDASYLFRFHSLPEDSGNMLAAPSLRKGRLALMPGECLVDYRFALIAQCQIGDELAIFTGDDSPVTDFLSQKTYTIAGLVDSPLYLLPNLGSSSKGSGSLDAFAYLPAEEFTAGVYTEVQIALTNPRRYSRFDQGFKDMSGAVEDKLQELGDEMVQKRRRVLIAQGGKEIEDSRRAVRASREALRRQEEILVQGERDWQEQAAELARQKYRLEQGLAQGRQMLREGRGKLDEARRSLEAGMAALRQGEKSISLAVAAGVNAGAVNAGEAGGGSDAVAASDVAAAFSGGLSNQALLAALEEQKKALATAGRQLEEQEMLLLQEELNIQADGYGQLAQLEAGERELELAADILADSRSALTAAKSRAETSLALAEKALLEGQKALANLPQGKCYVLGLEKTMGFGSFEQDSQRINSLSYTFPLVFFLVAALVAFTSIVRIIEDDRATAAAMVSLGYDTKTIMGKYLIYALAVAIPGTILGIAIGYRLLPVIVFNFGYRIMYLLPPIQVRLYGGLCAQAFLICLTSVVLPAFLVSFSLYKQSPAQLTRPKAPQGGKRVFLENIKTLWRSLSFSAKVTARNILRYKKRFAMTVVGIIGCTAIVLTGFGLRDSIKSITINQFERIYHFGLRITIADEAKGSERSALERFLAAEKAIEAWQYQHRENIEVSFRQKEDAHETTLVVPQDPENLGQFIRLVQPRTENTVTPTDKGAVITEKLASLLGVKAGDTITLKDEDDNFYQVPVAAVTENYVEHFLYMTPEQYRYVFDSKIRYNTLLCRTASLSQSRQDELGLAILDFGGVSALSYNDRVKDFYQDMIGSLNVVVLVLILSGALLSFVVLFCLTGINIDERKRELATLRVLGFYEEEAAAYVFRENIVNTIIGVLLGLGAGVLLHQYIIRTAEIDRVMFGKTIAWPSYIMAAVLTFLFTLFVNAVMKKDIRNIDMVESLKSVE